MRAANGVVNGVCLLVIAVLMSGCVTTKSGVYTSKADRAKAVEYSVRLARKYIENENWDKAKQHLQYALDVDPEDAPTHEAMALMFEETGELELAEKHYRKAIKYDPEFTQARHNYAVFLYNRGRYREAADELETVIERVLYSNRYEAFLQLGQSYMKLEKYVGAAKTFNRAHLMEKEAPTPMLRLAEAHYDLGNHVEAQQWYQRYRERVSKQSASGLWLGIRLAELFGDKDARASYALALKNLYPDSREYLAYRKYMSNRESDGKQTR